MLELLLAALVNFIRINMISRKFMRKFKKSRSVRIRISPESARVVGDEATAVVVLDDVGLMENTQVSGVSMSSFSRIFLKIRTILMNDWNCLLDGITADTGTILILTSR